MEFLIATSIKLAIIAFVLLTALAYIQWVERKVIAHVQVRMGPSRRRPSRPAAAPGRRDQTHHEGRRTPSAGQQSLLSRCAHTRRLHGAHFHLGDSVWHQHHHHGSQDHDGTGRCERRRPGDPGGQFDGCLRNCARWLGFQQQVQSDWRPPQFPPR